jgi:mannose-1-phosphate guanylyltransferase
MKHLHAVILAGGSGTRLWPLSTPGFPKQFLPLPSGKTMIQETMARIAPFICHKDHVQRVKELAENEQKFL